MSNRTFIHSTHRLLPGYAGLPSPRPAMVPSTRNSSPEFAYDSYTAATSVRRVRDSAPYSQASAPTSSALTMAYPTLQEFPYGLSGVQMPTYNFGSELYNYVSNGFPRKSRMCTYCNKVFTRSTTRRYHERRCPLLRASNSLAKNEENTAAAAKAASERVRDQRLDDLPSSSSPSLSSPRSSALNSLTPSSHPKPSAPTSTTFPPSPPPLLHPAYPASFPIPSAVSQSPTRPAFSYAHAYGSHLYSTLSAAALASIDQNSNALTLRKDTDNPTKLWDSPLGLKDSGNLPPNSSPSKSYSSNDSGVEVYSRYATEKSFRLQPPVFPYREPAEIPPSVDTNDTRPSLSNGALTPEEISSRFDRTVREKLNDSHIRHSPDSNSHDQRSPSPKRHTDYRSRDRHAEYGSGRDHVNGSPSGDDDEEEDEEFEEDAEEEVDEDQEQFVTVDSDEANEPSSTEQRKAHPYNPLVCQFCKKSFSNVTERKAHEVLHAQRKSYACALCSHAFHNAYGLRIHTLRHHKHGPFKCKYCLLPFESVAELKPHVMTHSIPSSELRSLKYLAIFGRSLSESAIIEEGSPKSLPRSHSVSNIMNDLSKFSAPAPISPPSDAHLASSDIKMPINDITANLEDTELCKICNKSFPKSFIRFHERSHADQKPYECPLCKKRFGYKNNMKSHMKLHQGLKPYQCQICGARFTRGSTLRRHSRRHNVSRNVLDIAGMYDRKSTQKMPDFNTSSISKISHLPRHPYIPPPPPPLSSEMESSLKKGYSQFQLTPRSHNSPPSRSEDRSYSNSSQPSPKTDAISLTRGNNHLHSPSITSPMVGNLAAVAAANLFAYPAAAAPQLYQLYASSQLMNSAYPAFTSNTQTVQSDALNLSVRGKRKSPFEDEDKERERRSKSPIKKEYDSHSPIKIDHSPSPRDEKVFIKDIEVKSDLSADSKLRATSNPFTPHIVSNPRIVQENHYDDQPPSPTPEVKKFHSQSILKISTEDFSSQVNMCCPSPLVPMIGIQSSLTNSPTGSSSGGTDPHCPGQPSPSGLSMHSSPPNRSISPSSGIADSQQLQDLLLSLLASRRLFRCSFCDIYFTEYSMHHLHQKYHQCDVGRPFVCAVCGEDCKDKTNFTVHLSEHLGIGPKQHALA